MRKWSPRQPKRRGQQRQYFDASVPNAVVPMVRTVVFGAYDGVAHLTVPEDVTVGASARLLNGGRPFTLTTWSPTGLINDRSTTSKKLNIPSTVGGAGVAYVNVQHTSQSRYMATLVTETGQKHTLGTAYFY